MATENPVFQVLPTSGNQAILAAGNKVDNLAVGQIGVFDSHTNKSVDASTAGASQDVYIAVGIGSGGVLQDIAKSAGQTIQKRNVKAYTFKPYLGSLPKIVEISGFRAKCNTDYTFRVELRNQQVYGAFGYNGLTKIVNYTTSCCDTLYGCPTCVEQGDTGELAVGLVNNINADKDGLIVASLFVNKISTTIGAAATASGDVNFKVGTENDVVTLVSGDSVSVVATKLAAAINSNTSSAYTASATAAVVNIYPKSSLSNNSATTISLTSAGGTGVTFTAISSTNVDVTDSVTFRGQLPSAGLAIRLTTVTGPNVPFNGSIPIKYYNAKESDLIVSLTDSFACNGVVTTIQQLQYEDGNGINLALDEYVAGGWNGKPGPYRTSIITGLEKQGFSHLINVATNYNVIDVDYDQFSVGGWLEYLNNLRTIIAVPCADTVTLGALVPVLDAVFSTFAPHADDATGIDCTNVATTNINDYSKDGIDMLS